MIHFNMQKIGLATATLLTAFTVSSSPLYDAESLAPDLADQDKDGVINIRDFCPNTPANASVDNDGCPSTDTKLLSVDLEILFDTGKYEVKPIYYSEVKKVADFMKENPGSSVVIEGHTDNVGKDDYNLELSKNRANAIAVVLIRQFSIDRSRVRGIGYGEERPIAPNTTAQGREQNRRVVAEVFAEQTGEKERWSIYSVDQKEMDTDNYYNSPTSSSGMNSGW